jgi:hypothetical protein
MADTDRSQYVRGPARRVDLSPPEPDPCDACGHRECECPPAPMPEDLRALRDRLRNRS